MLLSTHHIVSMRFRFLATLVIALAVAGGFPETTLAAIGDVPASGLVGHWNFDENTGTNAADSSGNGYNATLVNGPTWTTGIAGSAVSFATSSTNAVTFPAGLQSTSFPTSGTLTFWIKGDFSVQSNGSIFDNYATRNHLYVKTNGSSNLQIVLQDAAGNFLNQKGQFIYPSSSSITNVSVVANTWTHIAVVWDATNGMAYVYKNGSLAMEYFWGAYEPSWTPSAQVFSLSNSTNPFAGASDDVALYSRPLAATEISAIYNGTAAPTADTSAPTAPTSLAGSGFSPTKITLGWSASTDNVGIGGYIIYRDGVPAGYASSTALAYTDSGLATSTSHTYQVYAFDTSGNRSPASNSVTVSTNAADLLLSTNFEEESTVNTAEIGGWTKYGPNSNAVVVTTEQARAGAQSVKFNFNYSDWNSTDTNYHQRAQISQTNVINLVLGQTYWTGISTYIPTSWQDDYPTNAELIWQFHGAANGPAGASSPPLALYIDGNTENIDVRGATTTVYATAPYATAIGSMPLDPDKGKWIDWVIETTFNYSGGAVKVWKDGVKVADYTGPTIFHNTGQTNENGPYFATGPYKWDWGNLATQVSNRTMYADEIRQADNTASCTDVNPTGATLCDSPPSITPVTISSSNASSTLAKAGDVVTLSLTSNQAALITPSVTIAGHTATVLAGSNNTWTASTTLQAGDSEAPVTFSVSIGNNDGLGTTTVSSITSGANVAFDKTPPVISVNGSSPDSVYATTAYTDPGASALDAHDGAVTVTAVSSVNTSTPGTYTIVYTATDAAGNSASATRTVTVKPIGNGAPVGSASTPIAPPRPQIIYPDGHITYLDASSTSSVVAPAPPTIVIGTTSAASVISFLKNHQLNDRGDDIRNLQRLLNARGFYVSQSGSGSPGNETPLFGKKTYSALIKFQIAYGLPATGYFGPLTRALIAEMTTSTRAIIIEPATSSPSTQ